MLQFSSKQKKNDLYLWKTLGWRLQYLSVLLLKSILCKYHTINTFGINPPVTNKKVFFSAVCPQFVSAQSELRLTLTEPALFFKMISLFVQPVDIVPQLTKRDSSHSEVICHLPGR